ncbi:dihydroxyacetone kinase subunit DhaK [Citrobacter sp. NCU1]|uniref:dihydroxyacetone kinase subunit DhaK n=1 Tax=Citrobacter sp. NCU1 TaxID=2026683 RepID=UPI0013917242|nr:dihydroxyacetone kinase subunit DhaK [Citrobacter sp. NCU1]NDO79646.1 dihydroxyacetone kinase subunit DhaK [Citrobacter sp. NCU1]
MKKLINKIENVVVEQMEGMVNAFEDIQASYSPRYLWRTPEHKQVALISGGGAGHEPLHAGFIGSGMLTGACPGEIFTSPTPDQMVECAQVVENGEGVLFFIKNYTGDILNFETAVELLHDLDTPVGTVVIDDDVAVKDSLYTAGRRGVAGTVLVEKIVGAAAKRGHSLEQCETLGHEVNNALRSFGVALSACTVPAAGRPSFVLKDNEVEFGVGIHGEPGIERCSYHQLDELVDQVMMQIMDNTPYTRTLRHWDRLNATWKETQVTNEAFDTDEKYIVLINGLGGSPEAELYGVARAVFKYANEHGMTISRSLTGNYCTSLDMTGFSVTLLKCKNEWLELWDDAVNTPALRWGI